MWRAGESPAPQQEEGVSLKEGRAPDDGGVVSTEGVALKDLKEAEGTGLNILWPILRSQWQLDWTSTNQTAESFFCASVKIHFSENNDSF